MSFTTPPRPLDVTALFPQLAPLARTATRLHPRPGSPTVHDSSVGGPLLWPADEPWPHCDGEHIWDKWTPAFSPDDIRRQRRGAAAGEGRPQPEGPIPMLPVAQLYARDVPLPTPPGADLLQVLWCPFDHPTHPRTALFWRSAAEVTDVLAAPPEPSAVQLVTYLPEPCVLAPEQVTEYPNPMELSEDLQRQLNDVSRWETAGPAWNPAYAVAPHEFYRNELAHAPGWKTGGWSSWGLTDPMPRPCPACGTEALPLLTIASTEWDGGSESWAPQEEHTDPTPLPPGYPTANFTMIDIASGYNLQLHACPASPDHPHIELVQ
ncbi:hypothetical protein [Streptomyces sp. NPDC001604]|uniref:hypothetical protein n=1 Tax=Streptomyces sp. NPDC001604 TaxID=3364593 RepID=UPI00368A9DD5